MNATPPPRADNSGGPNVHVIRLRGPWRYRVLSNGGETSGRVGTESQPTGRIQMPADWGDTLGDGFHGRVEYAREFARPTGLRPGQRVELVLAGVDAFGSAALNDSPLLEVPAGGGESRVEIAALLEDRNRLVVEVELPAVDSHAAPVVRPPGREHSPGGLYGEVRLEIEEP